MLAVPCTDCISAGHLQPAPLCIPIEEKFLNLEVSHVKKASQISHPNPNNNGVSLSCSSQTRSVRFKLISGCSDLSEGLSDFQSSPGAFQDNSASLLRAKDAIRGSWHRF